MTELLRVRRAAAAVAERTSLRPEIGVILGSGLGPLADQVVDPTVIAYSSVPHLPTTTVPGHQGRLVVGRLVDRPVWMMQGRFHFYEGFSLEQVVRPVRMLASLGVKTLIITNAAGGINQSFSAGDVMLITDHINMFGTNPLLGPNEEQFGVRFPDMTWAYDERLQKLALKTAAGQKLMLRQGVYLGLPGPVFETPAEIRAFRALGADAIGMSTVPEVIAARHLSMQVLGLSCITNPAASRLSVPMTHEAVIKATAGMVNTLVGLVNGVVSQL